MRIAIVGSSGSGKSTLARQVSDHLAIRHVEFDAIHHLANWEPNPEFLRDLAAELAGGNWVCDGNYDKAEGISRAEADMIVVLDLPRWRVMKQLVPRTLRRVVTREELWNGNRESFDNLWRWDPERNVIRWSWVHFDSKRQKYLRASDSGEWAHAEVVWLHSRAQTKDWLASL